MKKYVSLSLIVLLLLQVFTPVYASDISEHWAYDTLSYFQNKGVIQGDASGLRPDDFVKRCEFAKMINKNFNLTESGENVFLDISENDWFYNDILIAVKTGYLKGDNGYVNPNGFMTRAEASVVLSRLIKSDAEETQKVFKDNDDIPNWAKDAVNKMVSLSIITGYGDGTFKPNNMITRAEACSLLIRTEDYEIGEIYETQTDNEQTNAVINTSGSSGGGGGGGSSGGGGTSPSKILPPVISRIDSSSNMLYFTSSHSGTYTVKLIRNTNNYNTKTTLSTTAKEVDLTSAINELMATDTRPYEDFSISVMVTYAGKSSGYSTAYNYKVVNPSVIMPTFTVTQSFEENEETVKINWTKDETVSSYKVELDLGDGYNLITYSEDGSQLSYTLSSSEVAKITGTAKLKVNAERASNDIIPAEEKIYDISLPLYGGEENGFNLVYNERHFRNIEKNVSASYMLKEDIILTSYTPFAFKGKLNGNNKKINVTIDIAGNDIGLFSYLAGAFEIYDLEILGSIKGAQYVGALAGRSGPDADNGVLAGAKITNVTNRAEVKGTQYVAGLIGRAYDNGSNNITASKIINHGKITASGNYGGGLFGLSTTMAASFLANCGEVTSAGYAGGIASWAYTQFNKCYNTGKISGGSYAGGIVGYSQSSVLTNSFNNGEISAANPGGLVGNVNFSNADTKLTISNSYNAKGSVLSALSSKTLYENCYYMSASLSDDGFANTKPLTEAQMRDISNFTLDTNVWEISNSSAYPYPQLKGFETYFKKNKLEKTEFTEIIYIKSENVIAVSFKPVTGSSGYKITCLDENSMTLVEEEINEAYIEFDASLFTFGKNYNVKVVALGDNKLYEDSDETSYTYSHKKDKLANPSIIGCVWESEGTLESYKVSWDASDGAAGYIIRILDSENVEKFKSDIITDTTYSLSSENYTLGSQYKVGVMAVTSDRLSDSDYSEITVNTAFAGHHTIESDSYFVISNDRHFKNIAGAPDGKYILNNDISLTDYSPITGFSGVLRGYNTTADTDEMHQITATITGQGLFATATGTVQISYITLNGSVTGAVTKTGGFIGETVSTSTGARISNCINKATVSNTANVQYVGGFIGYAGAEIVISNCVNTGNVTGKNHAVAGIVAHAQSSKTIIENCANYGTIQTTNAAGESIGGIAGYNYSKVNKCFNEGSIEGAHNVGGIIGRHQNTSSVSDCFNLGTVVAKTAKTGRAGGIVSYCYNKATISNVYNAGTVTGAVTGQLLGGVRANYEASIENGYYLSDTTDASTGALSEADMKDLNKFTGFSSDIWEMADDDNYDYPNLKTNKYIKK